MSGNIPFAAPSAIPRAPPLPAPRPLQRAREAANKFFGYQLSRPPSPQSVSTEETLARGDVPRYASLGAGNATASHKTGLEINTIAINELGTHAVLGGKEIFRTIKVEDGTCTEDLNLRSAIRSNPRTASGKTRQVYSVDVADVAWARGDCKNFIAAATSSGKIILYDLSHAGLQAAQLHEHFRHVHKITFNPHRGNLLLSGSQDGTVRLWDVRESRQASTLQSKRKYSGLGDGVRDVKWSPTEGVEFVLGTDGGWVQCWDMRNLKMAKVKISAHMVACNAVDWHPDGKHIASASSDMSVRVWDMTTTKRQRADWIIHTPYPVFNARWRPSCESSFNKDPSARQCTQIVTSYDTRHPALHVWDIRRPAIPFREMSPYPTAPTDFTWHSQDLLWTVGREGVFFQADLQHAPKVISKRNLQCFALSPQGDVNLHTQKRSHGLPYRRLNASRISLSEASNLSQSPESHYFERSWRDDSLDHSFLSVGSTHDQAMMTTKGRTASAGAASMLEPQSSMIKLDEILHHRKSFRPDQASVRGPLPVIEDVRLLEFFARNARFDLDVALKSADFIPAFEKLVAQNSASARYVCLYRLSQTWEIVRVAFVEYLKARADAKSSPASGVTSTMPIRSVKNRATLSSVAKELIHGFAKTPPETPLQNKQLAGIAQQVAATVSSSNPTTPQARPLRNAKSALSISSNLPDPDKEELTLPPLLDPESHRITGLGNGGLPIGPDQKLTAHNLSGLQKDHVNSVGISKVDMVRRWSVQPKEPLNLDVKVSDESPMVPPKLEKHYSNESFNFLEPSTASRESSFPSSLESMRVDRPPQLVVERPSRVSKRPAMTIPEAPETSKLENGRHASAAVPIPGSAMPGFLQQSLPKIFDSRGPIEEPAQAEPISRTEAAFGPDSYPDENGIVNVFESPAVSLEAEVVHDVEIQQTESHTPLTIWGMKHDLAGKFVAEDAPEKPQTEVSSLYLPGDADQDVEVGKAFTVSSMVQELITYYASRADAQTSAILALLLLKLLPHTKPLDQAQTTATALTYIEAFTAAGMNTEEALDVMGKDLDNVVKAGLQPQQIETILSTYHERLLSVRLWNEAATLRRLAYPAYPAVYEDFLRDNTVNLHCSSCGEILERSSQSSICKHCRADRGPCPICWSSASPFERPGVDAAKTSGTSLFTACLLCGHSGHAACLRTWFDESSMDDGGCPTAGCLCDCAAGSWRREKMRILELERRLRSNEKVRRDQWAARESRAVERTRTILGRKAANGAPRVGRASA